MLANINNNALKIKLSSNQNLAGNSVSLTSPSCIDQTVHSEGKKPKNTTCEEQVSKYIMFGEYNSSYRQWNPGWSLFYINHTVKWLRY